MTNEIEIEELEKSVDELTGQLAILNGDEEAIEKAEADTEELAEIAADIGALADGLEGELNKRSNEAWDAAVQKIVKQEKVSVATAMQKARQQNPELYNQFQKSGPAPHNRISGFAPLGPDGARRAREEFTSAVR